jgi:hypothetical protein
MNRLVWLCFQEKKRRRKKKKKCLDNSGLFGSVKQQKTSCVVSVHGSSVFGGRTCFSHHCFAEPESGSRRRLVREEEENLVHLFVFVRCCVACFTFFCGVFRFCLLIDVVAAGLPDSLLCAIGFTEQESRTSPLLPDTFWRRFSCAVFGVWCAASSL